MAEGISSLYTLRHYVPEFFKRALMIFLVITHLQYPAVLCAQYLRILTLEKQLNWAVKACYNSRNYDSSHDLKLINILPIRQYRVALCTWQIFKYINQPFQKKSRIALPTANRTRKLVNNSRFHLSRLL